MSVIDELLRNNEGYVQTFDKQALSAPPAKKLAVLACMDARMDVYKILGLSEGEAHIIRNAGGVVTDDAVRSLLISQRLLGTEEIVLIHHTKCGMASFDEDELRTQIERETGTAPGFPLGAFSDVEESVRASIASIRQNPFILHPNVRGLIFDIETGALREVEALE